MEPPPLDAVGYDFQDMRLDNGDIGQPLPPPHPPPAYHPMYQQHPMMMNGGMPHDPNIYQ